MKLERALDQKPVIRFQSGLQMRVHNVLAGIGLVLCALVLMVFSASIGSTHAGLIELLKGAFGSDIGHQENFALFRVRLPRILIGFMAGWCVALAGAMLQSLARNPLADPGLFGLSQGSMVVIMILLVLAPQAPASLIPIAALGGGLMVAGVLIWLTRKGGSDGLAILLMGIAIETILSSVSSILILYTPQETSYSLSDWLAGSLFQADWTGVLNFLPWLGVSFLAIFFIGWRLRAYDLGQSMASAIGEPVSRSRALILVAAVLLSSSAVTAVGPLMFLGVMAPHLAEFVSPATGRARLVLSSIMGGALVVAADCLTRGIGHNIPLPIGLSLTILGVPLFILTLRLRTLRRMQTQ